ncbi:uncharacterized protein LOC113475101 [Ciona intestinalis]
MAVSTQANDVTTSNITMSDVITRNITSSDVIIVPKTSQVQFIVALIVEAIIASCTIWLGASLIHYGIRTNRFKRRSGTDFNGGIVYIFAVLSTVTLLARICSSIVFISLPTYLPGFDAECERVSDATVALYLFALLPVYFLLWMRQRALYSHPTMAKSYNNFIIFLSWFSIVFLLAASVATLFIFVVPVTSKSGYSGCEHRDTSTNILNLVATAITVTAQILLLVLFIIPLRRHLVTPKTTCSGRESFRKKTSRPKTATERVDSKMSKLPASRPRMGSAVSTRSRPGSKHKSRPSNRVVRILKRSIIFASICLLTDLTAMLITTQALPKEGSRNFGYVAYDVSLLANLICIILSFENYVSMMFSCCTRKVTSPTDVTSTHNNSTSPPSMKEESTIQNNEQTSK